MTDRLGAMMGQRLSRAERRVLLVLLSGAPQLDQGTICRVARARNSTVTILLHQLENHDLARCASLRYFRLTDAGRTYALEATGLAGALVRL